MFGNAFSVVGAVVAVAGLGFFVAMAFVDSPDRFGLLPPGIFMIIFGLVFFRVGRRIGKVVWQGRDVLETGRPGRGVITKMWESGMTINDQPVFGFEMDLEVEGVPSGSVSVQQVVPRMLVGAVLPGKSVAVKVDPDDPSEVVIDWSEMPQDAARAEPAPSQPPQPAGDVQSMEELLRKGRRGTARLTSVADAGELGELGFHRDDPELADDRLYVIGMEVKLPGRSPYPAQVGHRVPDRLIGRVAPGIEVQVAVDRDEEQAIAIDWDASLP